MIVSVPPMGRPGIVKGAEKFTTSPATGFSGYLVDQIQSALPVGYLANDWSQWRTELLKQSVGLSDECYRAIPFAFSATGELWDGAEVLWWYLVHDVPGEPDLSLLGQDVNYALDHDLPQAIAILESCQ